LYKTSLVRTIIYINIVSKNKIDKAIGDDIKHYVYLADIHDDLGQQALSFLNLETAKKIIRNYILGKELITNRVKTRREVGYISNLPSDCQLLIVSLIN
jgi:hypothetical protein